MIDLMQPGQPSGQNPAPHTPVPQEQPIVPAGTPSSMPPQINVQNNQKPPKNKLFLKSLASFAVFVVSVFVLASLINVFVFQSYYVDGTSMSPTLKNSDRLIIDKASKTLAHVTGNKYIPKRGQIVILDSRLKDRNGNFEQLIKRVVGLPGERIVVNEGKVTIYNIENPQGFDVNKSLDLQLDETFTASPIDITIPKDNIYVMGDNRAPGGSYDSRSFGPVSIDDIEGRLWARILPLNETQIFD